MKIGLRTPLSPRTGYGRDGIGLARALLDRGHDVRISPTFVSVPLDRDTAGLFCYPYDAPFDLTIHHVEPQTVVLLENEASWARKNLFWSMWEWESLEPQTWSRDFSARIENFDYVVAYDHGTEKAFVPYVDPAKLSVVQGGYEANAWKTPTEPRGDHPYTFGMLGVLGPRKGPIYSITAFMMLKQKYGDDFNAQMILMSNVPVMRGFLPSDIKVLEGTWDSAQIQNFYWYIDTLLCPSTGEGKNLPAIEALASGTNVILSDIPAHTQWATNDIATIIPTTRTEVLPGHVGGAVDVEKLADSMWDAYNNRGKYRVRAETAARSMPSMMDWSKCIERLSLSLGLGL